MIEKRNDGVINTFIFSERDNVVHYHALIYELQARLEFGNALALTPTTRKILANLLGKELAEIHYQLELFALQDQRKHFEAESKDVNKE